MSHPIPVADRFWTKVDRSAGPDGCWLWIASIHTNGYGQIGVGRRPHLAHRVAYELEVGPIPDGLHLDHLCRVRLCVNPAHLEPVTPQTNVLRGVGPSSRNARKTHCPQGHPLAGDNLFLETTRNGRKKRHCKVCRREVVRRRWAKFRAAS